MSGHFVCLAGCWLSAHTTGGCTAVSVCGSSCLAMYTCLAAHTLRGGNVCGGPDHRWSVYRLMLLVRLLRWLMPTPAVYLVRMWCLLGLWPRSRTVIDNTASVQACTTQSAGVRYAPLLPAWGVQTVRWRCCVWRSSASATVLWDDIRLGQQLQPGINHWSSPPKWH